MADAADTADQDERPTGDEATAPAEGTEDVTDATVAQDAKRATGAAEPDPAAVGRRLNDSSTYQGCFACGHRNDAGLKLVFRREGDMVITEFTPDERFQGFPGVVHGGVLATLLDETLNRLALVEGRWMMTGRLDIRFRNAAPLGEQLRVSARAVASRSRALTASGAIALADDPTTLIATAEATFLPLPARVQQEAIERRPELADFFAL